jgi:hypothetical protein
MAHCPCPNKEPAHSGQLVNRTLTVVEDPDLSSNGTPPQVSDSTRRRRSGRGQPSPAQRSYLARGLDQPGGKLPLFDRQGREIARKTIESCLAQGWCQPWFDNPLKPDWVVCRLTEAGYKALGASSPANTSEGG